MKRAWNILLSLCLVLACLLSLPLAVEAEASAVTGVCVEMYGRKALSALDNADALLYAYDQLAKGVENCEKEISIYNGKNKISLEEVYLVVDAYGRDYTYHFWMGNSYSLSYYSQSDIRKLIPTYTMTGQKLENAKAAFNQTVDQILSGIHAGMSDYEIELYLHDTVAKKASYSFDGQNIYNAYGALVEGLAVCEGYSEALQYLLQRMGIQSFIIEGVSNPPDGGPQIPHAWNAVKIDGKFYQVDVTWDDQGDETYHYYFNLSQDMMLQDHAIYSTDYALPVCNSMDAFYFNVSNANLETYTVEKVAKLLKDNKGKVHVYVPGDMNEFLNWFSSNIGSIAQKAGVTGSFSYGYSRLGRELVLEIPQLQVEEPEHTHSYDAVITEPTCTKDGYAVYTCACGDQYQQIIPAPGHDLQCLVAYPPTCTEIGLGAGEYCLRCGLVLTAQEVLPALGHEEIEIPGVPPTCTASGLTESVYCTRCGEEVIPAEIIPALGHTPVVLPGVASSCSSAGLTEGEKCETCGKILKAQTVLPALDHTEVVDAAVAATCQKTGLTEGKHCAVCGKILIAQQVTDKLPHTEAVIPAVAPTCTATGLTEGKGCAVCGQILAAQSVIPLLDHSPVTVPGKEPTCTASGLTEGSKCGICGTTLTAQTILPALDHTLQKVPGVDAGCTQSGLTEGEKCSVCGLVTREQTSIPAKGHTWVDGCCETCGTFCSHSYDENGICTHCGAGCAHEFNPVIYLPTCTEPGYTLYHCGLCNYMYNDDYVDALGHSWQDATCYEAKRCNICGIYEGEPAGHVYTTVVVPPTCTESGYTEYICHCGYDYKDDFTEPTDHIPGTPVKENIADASCTVPGSYETVVYCTGCGMELTREWTPIPAPGHSNADTVKAPTCTEQGYTTHTCTVCGAVEVDSYVPANGHSFGEWGVVSDATCTEEGLRRRDCQVCGQYETETLPAAEHDWNGNICNRCGESRNPWKVEISGITGVDSVYVDGREYPVTVLANGIRVELEDSKATNLVIYTYNDPDAADPHSQYPTGMRVWLLSYEDGAYTATLVPEFDNLLNYSGSSIRVTGKNGIRMITSIQKSTRQALIAGDLAGFRLVEYGTAVAWAHDLTDDHALVLGDSCTMANYAYRRGEADPVFKDTGDLIQYTNVLVGFSLEQCVPDLVMRPYIILENEDGEQITLYGGLVQRSIGYIAWQNRDVFAEDTAAYRFVRNIVDYVYG